MFTSPHYFSKTFTIFLNLNKLKLERLIYISCNPASLVRDLKELEKVYDIKEICPVDNFQYTAHVECVALLQLEQDM